MSSFESRRLTEMGVYFVIGSIAGTFAIAVGLIGAGCAASTMRATSPSDEEKEHVSLRGPPLRTAGPPPSSQSRSSLSSSARTRFVR